MPNQQDSSPVWVPVIFSRTAPFNVSPYMDIIYRHRLAAVCVLVVGLATTVFLAALLPNQYKSSALIMIEAPQVAAAYVNLPSASANSREQPANVADQLEAIARTSFTQPRLKQIIDKYGLYPGLSGQSTQVIVNRMRKHIGLAVPPDAIQNDNPRQVFKAPEVLRVSFVYPNRLLAQRVTAELTSLYIDQGYQDRIQRAVDAAAFVQNQVTQTKARLAEQDTAIQQFQRRYQGSLPEDLETNSNQLSRLEDRLQALNDRINTPNLSPVTGQQIAVTPRQQLKILELNLVALKAQYSDDYPDVIDLKSQIANLKAQVQQDGGKDGADDDRASAQSSSPSAPLERETSELEGRIATVRSQIASSAQHGEQLAALTRDHDASAAEYHALLDKQLAADLQEKLEKRQQDERLRLLEPASFPKAAEAPSRFSILCLGLVFSFVLALLAPFGLFYTDTSFKSTEELHSEYGIRVAAAIPLIESKAERRTATFKAMLASTTCLLVIAAALWVYVTVLS